MLWKLNDDLQAHTLSLAALGIDGDKYGVILTPLISLRLPQDIRLEWSREGKGNKSYFFIGDSAVRNPTARAVTCL